MNRARLCLVSCLAIGLQVGCGESTLVTHRAASEPERAVGAFLAEGRACETAMGPMLDQLGRVDLQALMPTPLSPEESITELGAANLAGPLAQLRAHVGVFDGTSAALLGLPGGYASRLDLGDGAAFLASVDGGTLWRFPPTRVAPDRSLSATLYRDPAGHVTAIAVISTSTAAHLETQTVVVADTEVHRCGQVLPYEALREAAAAAPEAAALAQRVQSLTEDRLACTGCRAMLWVAQEAGCGVIARRLACAALINIPDPSDVVTGAICIVMTEQICGLLADGLRDVAELESGVVCNAAIQQTCDLTGLCDGRAPWCAADFDQCITYGDPADACEQCQRQCGCATSLGQAAIGLAPAWPCNTAAYLFEIFHVGRATEWLTAAVCDQVLGGLMSCDRACEDACGPVGCEPGGCGAGRHCDQASATCRGCAEAGSPPAEECPCVPGGCAAGTWCSIPSGVCRACSPGDTAAACAQPGEQPGAQPGGEPVDQSGALDLTRPLPVGPAHGVTDTPAGHAARGVPDRNWDIDCGVGETVRSPASGTVVRVVDGLGTGLANSYGNQVCVRHAGSGLICCIAHLQAGSLQVAEGCDVQAGAPLGGCGTSGSVIPLGGGDGSHVDVRCYDDAGTPFEQPHPDTWAAPDEGLRATCGAPPAPVPAFGPCETPTLEAPAPGARVTLPAEFAWTSSLCDEDPATAYRRQMSDRPDFSAACDGSVDEQAECFAALNETTSESHAVLRSGRLPADCGVWFWRVRAGHAGDATRPAVGGEWSEVRRVDLGPCAEAPGPCMDADGDGATDQRCGGDDCADDDERRHPGAIDRACDGIDQDCDGQDLRLNGCACPGGGPLNACGGCAALTDAPGERCGRCEGQVECLGPDAVACADRPFNACGACGALPAEIPCNGVDEDCDGADLRPNGCACPSGGAPNACGGCQSLAGQPGDACGACDGHLVCDGGERLLCRDAPRNACGQCGPLPVEVCDGRDQDCDGVVDDGARCPSGEQCVGGACRPACQERVITVDACALHLGEACPGFTYDRNDGWWVRFRDSARFATGGIEGDFVSHATQRGEWNVGGHSVIGTFVAADEGDWVVEIHRPTPDAVDPTGAAGDCLDSWNFSEAVPWRVFADGDPEGPGVQLGTFDQSRQSGGWHAVNTGRPVHSSREIAFRMTNHTGEICRTVAFDAVRFRRVCD